MWVCKTHVKEALKKLDAPHFYSAPKGIGMKCTVCSEEAIANMYYAHKPLGYAKKNNPTISPEVSLVTAFNQIKSR